MFRTFMLIFRKKILERLIVKLYEVVSTLYVFLSFVLENNEDKEDGTIDNAIAGISISKIERILRILNITSIILKKGAKYLVGIDLSVIASARDPLNETVLIDLENGLLTDLEEIKRLEE